MMNLESAPRVVQARRLNWREYVVYIGFAVIFAAFAIGLNQYGFLSGNNLLNIIRQTATISVMAVAMTFVISSAEIDLSVGAVAGLGSVAAALTISSYGIVPGILVGLLAGMIVGVVNGLDRKSVV